MTTKPPRTTFEDTKEESIRHRKREQEEREARRSLRDFLRHQREESDEYIGKDDDAPPNTF